MTLIIAGVFIFLVWFYVLFARDFLIKRWPDQWGWWHTFEDKLWSGSKTIIVARAYQLGGWLLALQTMLASAGIDTTPFTNQLAEFIPERYRPLALSGGMILTGLAFVWLRKRTSQTVEASKMEVGGGVK